MLSGRVSRVHVGGEYSGAILMHSGAPHGSVMGPLLFLLFVNGLPDVLEALTLHMEDDVKLVTRRTQNMGLHSSPTATWEWLKKLDLPTNPAKCNNLTIGRVFPLRSPGSGTPIPVSKLIKDLGVQIDNVSSPSARSIEAANKARRLIFVIWCSFQGLSKSAFIPLNGALVSPHLEYASLFTKPRGRYQSFKANSKISRKVGPDVVSR